MGSKLIIALGLLSTVVSLIDHCYGARGRVVAQDEEDMMMASEESPYPDEDVDLGAGMSR